MLLNMDISNQSEEQPLFLRLLIHVIGPEAVQTIIDQSKQNPSVPLEELLLNGGYVTEIEMKSLRIAKSLLEQGKVTEEQIKSSMAANLQLPPDPN
jgi:hypothetical protein